MFLRNCKKKEEKKRKEKKRKEKKRKEKNKKYVITKRLRDKPKKGSSFPKNVYSFIKTRTCMHSKFLHKKK